jgi:hypothetical protein
VAAHHERKLLRSRRSLGRGAIRGDGAPQQGGMRIHNPIRGLVARCIVPMTLLFACTVALRRQDGQCRSHADCQALSAGYLCAANGVCAAFDAGSLANSSPGIGHCSADADCSDLGLAVCRRGMCLGLNAPDGDCVSNGWGTTVTPDRSSVILIGMLAPRGELFNSSARVVAPIVTALDEINRSRTPENAAVLPALVGVACDEAQPLALDYLLDDLAVNIVIGPADPSRVEPTLAQIGGRAALWTPYADGPHLREPDLTASGWLVGCKPNRFGLQTYFLSAVSEVQAELGALATPPLGTISPTLAISGDLATTAFAAGFSADVLDAAGVRAVQYTAGQSGRGLISALQVVRPFPNLVIAASSVDRWGENIAAFDRVSYDQTRAYPYYLLSEKRTDVYSQTINDQATANGFPAQYRRFMGLDYHRDGQTALAAAAFSVAFRDKTGALPEAGVEYAYDCAYVAVYSAVAAALRYSIPASELPAEALVEGLESITGSGPLLPVGEPQVGDVVNTLIANHGANGSVNLVGASGGLEFVGNVRAAPGAAAARYVAPKSADGELYCIDVNSKEYCDSGIIFSAIDGSITKPRQPRCSCLGVP